MTRVVADWVSIPASQKVCGLLTEAGYQALFVGGCVRNALMDLPVADLDIATSARPETVVSLAEAAGLRTIPTGIDHGTVTVMADHIPYEITTFRRDVSADGRRATVAFADDIVEDARRRDFTMNALYTVADGTLHDPLGGLPDLQARRVRFIGKAEDRIREDYLRILRFFRFHAIYGDPDAGLDADGLAACAALADGIGQLSAERVGAEMRKLLGADDPAPSVAAMAASGVLKRVLPGADPKALAPLIALEQGIGIAPRWQRRLGVLGQADWTDALRLSRQETRALREAQSAIAAGLPPAVSAYHHGAEAATDAILILSASLASPPTGNWQAEVARGAAAEFPLRARDLMDRIAPGPALGAAMTRLEDAWIASDFALGKADLLAIDLDEAL
ncbi:CCA tRNA nucleotidyltransferase [Halovulum sp. GXIMD14793]